ncbi:MAG TPA: alpha/beta hydrolase [Acidimicrobiales bacterium]|nr:alpha/beta hydrolase [Acidimicrobiales bacterium]
MTVDRGLVYRSDPSRLLDLFRPAGDHEARRPAIVWVHGGGFSAGDRGASIVPFPDSFARSGYVVASIDYDTTVAQPCVSEPHLRQDCRDAFDSAVADGQQAVRWLKRNAGAYGIDPDRVAIAGESAGGITAAGVGTRSTDAASSVRAWISISGGLDGVGDVDAKDAPALLFANTDDPYVPFAWSADVESALRRAGVTVQLVAIDGVGHVPADHIDQFVSQSRDFLRRELDLD